MQPHYRPDSAFGKQELVVGKRIVEKILREHRRGIRMPENVELALKIRIAVGPVLPNPVPGKMPLRSPVKTGDKAVSLRLPLACIGAPAGGRHPLGTVAGSIAVNGSGTPASIRG